jgi:glyoxylase-like metal-dependent hydrolase (beta-lactamase superfamily II)
MVILMVELVPGVHLVDSPVGCNTYLIIGDGGVTLVDTGLKGNEKRIYRCMQKLGYKPRDIERIIITHAHLDHINCLHRLKEDSGAQVMVSEADSPIVEGKKPIGTAKGIYGLVLAFLRVAYYRYEPVKVDVMLGDGDAIDAPGGLEAIMLGGHSEGNMGLYSPDRRLLFSSDTVRVIGDSLAPPSPKFTEDPEGAIRAIKRLSGLDFDAMLPGHGKPVMENASEKVRELYAELKH